MPNNIAHFEVFADDPARRRHFHERAFGWQFRPFGPPDFYTIQSGRDEQPGIHGSLTRRLEALRGPGVAGFECTIGVADM